MKTLSQITALIFAMASAVAGSDDAPRRVSIAPKNDLSALIFTAPRGTGFGSAVCGYHLSKEFEDGYKVGAKNNHFGKRDILVIDDGKSSFPAKDKDTGLPVVILTDGKITKELQDLVRGYNTAMQEAFEQRKKKTEPIVAPNRSSAPSLDSTSPVRGSGG
jgi:hypothetical protein